MPRDNRSFGGFTPPPTYDPNTQIGRSKQRELMNHPVVAAWLRERARLDAKRRAEMDEYMADFIAELNAGNPDATGILKLRRLADFMTLSPTLGRAAPPTGRMPHENFEALSELRKAMDSIR